MVTTVPTSGERRFRQSETTASDKGHSAPRQGVWQKETSYDIIWEEKRRRGTKEAEHTHTHTHRQEVRLFYDTQRSKQERSCVDSDRQPLLRDRATSPEAITGLWACSPGVCMPLDLMVLQLTEQPYEACKTTIFAYFLRFRTSLVFVWGPHHRLLLPNKSARGAY